MNALEPDPGTGLLTAAALRQICDFLYRRTGIMYGESKRYYIERRLAQAVERTQSTSVAAYITRLLADGAEAEALVNSFTVNETYFYREVHQFRCLSRALLPEIIGTRIPGDLVRIWSAPCATGEEPYSIAIWLLENWPLVDAYNIEIVGSDVDTDAIAAALDGHYGVRALSRLPADLVERYFEPPVPAGALGMTRRIIKDLRESIHLRPANLMDAQSVRAQGRFDVIFCRNMLIYFDDASRPVAAKNLFDALAPGGFICLGHTESMTRISDLFAVRRFEDAIVYQRPAG